MTKTIEIDDKVSLKVSKTHKGYNYRVIDVITNRDTQEKTYRLVRLFKNEKMGDTTHYTNQKFGNLILVKKNPRYEQKQSNKKVILSIEI